MERWQHRIEIKDIHDMFDGDEGKIGDVGKAMAQRLRDNIPQFKAEDDREELEALADEFQDVTTVYHYDHILNSLYDWADNGKKCWIASF